tara:strand:- start:437 stop:661 length:225 start_codon:yes stop_codon:yes gene_type:complete
VVDYRKFYPCPNKGILDPLCGSPEGYVTKDGMWAAIPLAGCKKLAIINNGEWVHTSRNYQSAKNYILKESKKSK